jgi:uncharacterized protein (DUF58 family)
MALAAFAPVLEAARGLDWPARRRARAAVPGAHVAISHRTAAELVEYRPYRQGEETARIDWKLVARTDRVFVRLSPDRALLPTVIMLDASGSMAFPAPALDKWMLGCHLALGLAAIARAAGDPAGLLVARETASSWMAPSTRRSTLDRMMAAMVLPPVGTPSLSAGLAPVLRKAARLVIVSDFLGDAEPLLSLVRPFALAGGETHAVHIVARGEIAPDPRTLLCADPENDVLRRPLSSAVRARYLRAFGEWRTALARDWRRAGARFTQAVPGDESLRQLFRRILAVSA